MLQGRFSESCYKAASLSHEILPSPKALPSALFGGGIPDGDCAWATPVGNALYRVALGYEQSPGKGQKAAPNLAHEQSPGKGQKAAPNLAIEEQPRAPTWAAELAVANVSLSNRLLRSKGPTTWPRLFARAKLARDVLMFVSVIGRVLACCLCSHSSPLAVVSP